jgi:hypothetical protein
MTRTLASAFAFAALLTAAACSKDAPSGAASAEESDPADGLVIKSINEDLATAATEVKSADPGKAKYTCAAIEGMATQTKNGAVLAKVKQVCGHDVPLAMLKAATEAAEQARAKKPSETVLSECFTADVDMAKESLTKAGAIDAAAKALLTRFAKACPA